MIKRLFFGDYLDFQFSSERIILESIELFINQTGDMVSDIKLTFFDLEKSKKRNTDSHSIVEVEPMYITLKKLTKMSNLSEFINNLIDEALKEHQ